MSAAVRLTSGILLGMYAGTYHGPAGHPAPAYVRPVGVALAAVLVVAGAVQWFAQDWRAVPPFMFAIDVTAPVAYVWLYLFDPTPNVFVFVFIGVVQGALAFGSVGALIAWAITSGGYAISEAFAQQFTGIPTPSALVLIRVAVALFIALLVGGVTHSMIQAGAEREVAERARELSEELLVGLFEASPTALIAVDPDGIVQAWSPAAERLFGWTAQEAMGRFLPFVPPDKATESDALRARVLSGTALVETDVVRSRKDGSEVEIDLSLAPIPAPDGSVARIVAAVTDVTARRRAEREIRRLNRALRTLSLCNQAIVRITDERQLAEVVCRTLVVHGGFRAAWVGSVDDDEAGTVRPIAVAGGLEHVLRSARIRCGDDPTRRGPSATAAATGVSRYVGDLAADPTIAPWSPKAATLGIASLAALPILVDGDPVAVLTVLSGEREPFDETEREFLGELVDDLAFGIATIRSREERERVSHELAELETRYRALVDAAPAIVYLAEPGLHGRWLFVSPRVVSMLGIRPEALLDDPDLWWRHVHSDDRERVQEAERLSERTGERLSLEYRMTSDDGRAIWVQDTADVVPARGGTPARLLGLVFDVTERRLGEEELKRTVERLHRTSEQRRRLAARLIDAEERERERIASDIHDDAIQAVTAVSLRLALLREHLPAPELKEGLQSLEDAVDSAIRRLRTLVFELRPSTLDEAGLGPTLMENLERVFGTAGIEWTFDDHSTLEPDREVRTTAYRIAREALVNARKHARAAHIDVRLDDRDDGHHVLIRDDGVGFDADPSAPDLPGHLGLATMRERAELAGGWLRLASAPGRGTTVEFWLPNPGGAEAPAPSG